MLAIGFDLMRLTLGTLIAMPTFETVGGDSIEWRLLGEFDGQNFILMSIAVISKSNER